MGTITLYVKDADEELIEKAKKKLGESLSSVFIDCVRKQLDELKPRRAGEFRKITLEVGEAPMKKSFEGCWLVGNQANGIHAEGDDSDVQWSHQTEYSVALTKHGRIVAYTWNHNTGRGEMKVYDEFEEMRDDTDGPYPAYPENVIAETAAALGKEHEVELDI